MTVTTALQWFLLVVLSCLSASSANPITLPPTTVDPTMIATTETAKSHYEAIVQETTMLDAQFGPMLQLFLDLRFPGNISSQKTGRMNQSNAIAPDMDIRGFLTVKDDLPSMHERMSLPESELLQKHKLFLQTYEQVMISLEAKETEAYRTHPNNYNRDFSSDYSQSLLYIQRLLHKVSELMTFQEIADGASQSFNGFQAVPLNFQVHNTRSLYVLQSIDEYIDASLFDFNYRIVLADS